ncbi:respiratory nitrate reductase subunit gamma [Sinomonas terrae]|uniref:Respiratory nitrate reductase subunit gamma n=1 Tax=Sinomonas terrae TaxID=2908838 RepID=A0ABS9TXY7_9MICC|nr:respiratory nitrate reductase subunit gamma [Sinomonas terrae]MCH6469288.1 respiratory nitrate reductase subunit gamma [Sinomonas terrae]
MDVLLWGVAPYLMVLILVGGSIWRYRYDKFGWTTRSSQLYESRLLRIASPLFHFGLVFVIAGHFVGLVIPKSWTQAIGMSETLYHALALSVGLIAGICTLVGIVLLIYRRRRTGPVFMATTRNDKAMYIFLVGAIALGVLTTLVSVTQPTSTAFDYRESVSPWFRSLFVFQPNIAAMSAAPDEFKWHTLVGMALFALWPFTRLVHALTAPFHYLFRPYIVYRSRDAGPTPGARPSRRGWERIGTSDRDR